MILKHPLLSPPWGEREGGKIVAPPLIPRGGKGAIVKGVLEPKI